MEDADRPKPEANNFVDEIIEVRIGVRVLNSMRELGRPELMRTWEIGRA
ncbi:hypothetical protein CES85_3039 (plasmid) [Ochrobactrum quorumnocens]|uniref:Uncharacterized protein n=1 Tax=Ochrobactrum quorumnocens TaxID=271865 RepID=A0A248UPY7_9HYPH|nr:hypothetical protein CES85_3039 [[Ochrobactrum] quorumnocens]